MNYLLWSLPMLVIAGAIAIARLNATQAAALGLLATVPVAIYAGDTAFGGAQLALALERGAWIGATIAPYILGGLLFWQAAARRQRAADGGAASPPMPATGVACCSSPVSWSALSPRRPPASAWACWAPSRCYAASASRRAT